MNRFYSILAIVITSTCLLAHPTPKKPASAALLAKQAPKVDESLVATETRKYEVITKATMHYFKVAPETPFSTFNHELDFITDDRLAEFNRYENAKKHSDAAKSTCKPVQELLEILKTTQQELLTSDNKKKAVVVKLSFKEAEKTTLIKFEFSKKINEEIKTVESLLLKISIFGFEDEVDEAVLNFVKACALENTLWQNTKPIVVGITLAGSVLGIILAGKASHDNKAQIKSIRPLFTGLAKAVAEELETHHRCHPSAFVSHSHETYTNPWFSNPVRTEPYFGYQEPAAFDGLWEPFGLTFASTKLSEDSFAKHSGVVATAWLPGSFATLCNDINWETQTHEQDRILLVPYSVFVADTQDFAQQLERYNNVEAQIKAQITAINEQLTKATEPAEKLLLGATLKREVSLLPLKLAAAKQACLMTERLNVGGWSVIIVNDGTEDLKPDASPVKDVLAKLNSYVVVTTKNLTDATTKTFEAQCKLPPGAHAFNVTAEDPKETPIQTLARITVSALFSSTKVKTTYQEQVDARTTRTSSITKTEADVLPRRRASTASTDRNGAYPRICVPYVLELAAGVEQASQKKAELAGLEMFVASTNELTKELTAFLARTVIIGTTPAPRVVFVPSPLIELCANEEFKKTVKTAAATIVVVNTGDTDTTTKTTVNTSTLVKTDKTVDFVTKAQKKLADFDRAIIVPCELAKLCYKSNPGKGKYQSLRDLTKEEQITQGLQKIYSA